MDSVAIINRLVHTNDSFHGYVLFVFHLNSEYQTRENSLAIHVTILVLKLIVGFHRMIDEFISLP